MKATEGTDMANPTEAELKLMRALWSKGRMSARELQEATEVQTGWSFSTTRKTLERMTEKGLVEVALVHGVKTFVAGQDRLETMARLIRRFARNILDADGPLPAATFVQSKMIDAGEIDELEALLSQFEKEGE